MVDSQGDMITVWFENGKKSKFKINLQHVKEGTA